jgi:C1A family cysteine protease
MTTIVWNMIAFITFCVILLAGLGVLDPKRKVAKRKIYDSTLKPERKYGWTPDIPDQRDFKFIPVTIILPPKVDLRMFCPPVYEQGSIGSCTANAIAAAMDYERIKKGKGIYSPSRLFIYYNERVMNKTVSTDSGAPIRDGIKSVNSQGVCKELTWPYDITKFAIKPTLQAYNEAKSFESKVYSSVTQDAQNVKQCLASGYPIVFGFTVYQSFESDFVAHTGKMPMPAKTEKSLGGHACLTVGYDDSQKVMIVRNSWGDSWGDGGYFYMPYDYFFSNLTSDFWVIKDVTV